MLEPPVAVWRQALQSIERMRKQLIRQAVQAGVPRRLMTVSGVGPIVASAYAATIDDRRRFRSENQVAAYVGLVPSVAQLGELDVHEHITREGMGCCEVISSRQLMCFCERNGVSSFAPLRDGSFLGWAANVIAFGNPRTGKTHLLCGLGQELVRRGRSVLFSLHAHVSDRPRAPRGQAGTAPSFRAQAARPLRSRHPRRHRIRAAEQGGDGRALWTPAKIAPRVR